MKRQEAREVFKAAGEPTKAEINEAKTVTALLKSQLRGARKWYIRIGILLARVRSKALFEKLGYVTIEEYADDMLQLRRSTLYNYLKIHDWILNYHKEWLATTYSGFLPDLYQIGYLIRIEARLANGNLDAKTRAALDAVRTKALNGTLREKDIEDLEDDVRTTGRGGIRGILTSLRSLRKQACGIAAIPPDVITQLDGVIERIMAAIKANAA